MTVTLGNPSHEVQFCCPKYCTSTEPKDVVEGFAAWEKGKAHGWRQKWKYTQATLTPSMGLLEVLGSFFLPSLKCQLLEMDMRKGNILADWENVITWWLSVTFWEDVSEGSCGRALWANRLKSSQTWGAARELTGLLASVCPWKINC